MKVTLIGLMVGIFVTVLGFLQNWVAGIVMFLLVILINIISNNLNKDASTRVDE